MRGHVPCAVDLETTGTLSGYHEIIQIACVPLNQHFDPDPKRKFFYINIAPDYPDRINPQAIKKHGIKLEDLEACISQEKAADLFEEWFNNLDLPMNKRLIPLAHNWGFERTFLIHWLGMDRFNALWQSTARDSMIFANSINDLYCWHGRKPPFDRVNLGHLCGKFDIKLDNAHDALADCIATAKLYGAMMRFLAS